MPPFQGFLLRILDQCGGLYSLFGDIALSGLFICENLSPHLLALQGRNITARGNAPRKANQKRTFTQPCKGAISQKVNTSLRTVLHPPKITNSKNSWAGAIVNSPGCFEPGIAPFQGLLLIVLFVKRWAVPTARRYRPFRVFY